MKRSPQFVGLVCMLAVLAPLALAQETHISREGDGVWGQEVAGTLAAKDQSQYIKSQARTMLAQLPEID